jgi:ABC-type branched-subunit amino acid transport system substrate-binding protein
MMDKIARSPLRRLRAACRILAAVAASSFALSTSAAPPAAEIGVSNDEIVLGQSTALSGPLAEIGIDTSLASKAYFDHINQKGGVNGRKIRLITLDDAYNTDKAIENAKTLIDKERVFALFNMFGTPANTALLPTITQAGIPSIAPYTGSQALRTPLNRLVFNVRASYADETEKIVEHLEMFKITTAAVVYQNNAFGKDGLASVEAAMARRKLKVHASASIENDASDAAKAAKTLADSRPQAIIMITAGKASVEFVKAYDKLAKGMQFFTLSVMGTQASVNALGKEGVGIVVSQVAPFPFAGTTAAVREYQQIMAKAGVKNLSFTSMEGFLNAKVVVEGLRRAGRNLTRANFIDALESMGSVDLGGFHVGFGRNNHQASKYVELTIISADGRFVR